MANKATNDDKEKTSLYIQKDLMKSIKYISFYDEKTQTDILQEALQEYVTRWEKKNGAVPKKA